MNLNDRHYLYFLFDLTRFPLKFSHGRPPVRRGNRRDNVVGRLQRYLTIDSAPIVAPSLTLPANSRSPPLSNMATIHCIAEMQFTSKKLHS